MTKWKNFKTFISPRKLRTKLTFLILIIGICCFVLFRFLWHRKWQVYYFLAENIPANMQFFPMQDNNFWMDLTNEAKKHTIPASEDDKEAIKDLEPFFDLADEYTSIYIYGIEDGLFRTGHYPESMLWNEPFNTFFSLTYRWIDEDVDQVYERAIEFKNGYAYVMVYFYHSSFFLVPYAIFCLILCVFLFLFFILIFVDRKLKTVIRLKENILQMSSGDLTTPIPGAGLDEIGILCIELDNLRSALYETIQREQHIHKSNQELIAALSHDLRTPLTILKGYLEIFRLNRNPDMQTEYLNRCMQKTEDIQEMTDRMFEYALIYDESADEVINPMLSDIPLTFFVDILKEHSDFLRLTGFQTNLNLPDIKSAKDINCLADFTMIKRIFNNLFSNIIKYADKKEIVEIFIFCDVHLTILLQNNMKKEYEEIESTQIGLKSVQKMTERMNGTLILEMNDGFFTARLQFPLS